MWVCIVGESEDEGVSLQCQVEVRVGCVSAVSGGSEDEGVCLQRQVEVRGWGVCFQCQAEVRMVEVPGTWRAAVSVGVKTEGFFLNYIQ